MRLGIIRNWQTSGARRAPADRAAVLAGVAPKPSTDPPTHPDMAPAPDVAWPAARIAAAEAVWGEGFLAPGGHEEMLRLARPMGLSDAASLLLVGAGTGGAVRSLAGELGVWVTGFEADHDLAAVATRRSLKSGLGRRADIETWDPLAPRFGPNSFHHGLALEPLRGLGRAAAPVLAAIAAGIKRNGQLTVVEVIAEQMLDPDDPTVAAWARLEQRSASLPTRAMITRIMGRLGFDVRVVEDISDRHMAQTLERWNAALEIMRHQLPSPVEVHGMVAEAELWLLRQRLMRTGQLRLLRWHGIAKKG